MSNDFIKPVIPRRKKVLQIEVPVNNSTNPVDLLNDVYLLIKRDIERYKNQSSLSDAQSKTLRGHGEFLISATKQIRESAKDDQTKAAKLSDEELEAALLRVLEKNNNSTSG
jgi:hypothetical protein